MSASTFSIAPAPNHSGNSHSLNVVALASASLSSPSRTSTTAEDSGDPDKKKRPKRRKVNHACLYCRRSHMTCDEGRPCQRCIKREIGHLCHDERKSKVSHKQVVSTAASIPHVVKDHSAAQTKSIHSSNSAWPMVVAQGNATYHPETFGSEFSVLTDFLETLDERTFFTPPATVAPPLLPSASFSASAPSTTAKEEAVPLLKPEEPVPIILPAATKTERFLLTAADQASGTRDERLRLVISSKYEAGLLKPYNYVKGYSRLLRWMARNVSQASKQQIMQPLSVLRPKFRAVAQSLSDLDLVFIEEEFERLLLDYDRVFSAMGIPACLWRRTGEIYKGNREFTELVGVDAFMLRDGRSCIYELMAEESAVNYWEKYGNVAFDSTQKAVITSCSLRYKPVLQPGGTSAVVPASSRGGTTKGGKKHEGVLEEGFIDCSFCFTIRRDKWGIPSMIVGNFIKY